jgi:hypothetical protein
MITKENKYYYFELSFSKEYYGDIMEALFKNDLTKLKKDFYQNSNQLVFRPHTNTSGVWGYLNPGKIVLDDMPESPLVYQYWVDMDRYDNKNSLVNFWLDNIFPVLKDVAGR